MKEMLPMQIQLQLLGNAESACQIAHPMHACMCALRVPSRPMRLASCHGLKLRLHKTKPSTNASIHSICEREDQHQSSLGV